MAVKKVKVNQAYDSRGKLIDLYPRAIVSDRAPATTDKAQVSQLCINSSTNAVSILTSVTNGSSTWTTIS